MSKILSILIIAGSIVMVTLSCKSTKTPGISESKLIIQLDKKLSEVYISEKYAMYEPQKIRRSNKTLNQYMTTFALSDLRYKGLIRLLNEDSNVIEIIERDKPNVDRAVNSTNQMKSEAVPKPPTK